METIYIVAILAVIIFFVLLGKLLKMAAKIVVILIFASVIVIALASGFWQDGLLSLNGSPTEISAPVEDGEEGFFSFQLLNYTVEGEVDSRDLYIKKDGELLQIITLPVPLESHDGFVRVSRDLIQYIREEISEEDDINLEL